MRRGTITKWLQRRLLDIQSNNKALNSVQSVLFACFIVTLLFAVHDYFLSLEAVPTDSLVHQRLGFIAQHLVKSALLFGVLPSSVTSHLVPGLAFLVLQLLTPRLYQAAKWIFGISFFCCLLLDQEWSTFFPFFIKLCSDMGYHGKVNSRILIALVLIQVRASFASIKI